MLDRARLGPEAQVRKLFSCLLLSRGVPRSGLKHWDGDGRKGGTIRMEFQKAEESRADEEGVPEVNCGWDLAVCPPGGTSCWLGRN